jgi:hypothetical protein
MVIMSSFKIQHLNQENQQLNYIIWKSRGCGHTIPPSPEAIEKYLGDLGL